MLPLSVQDLGAKERYATSKSGGVISGRYTRMLCCVGFLVLATVALMVRLGNPERMQLFGVNAQGENLQKQGAAIAAMDQEDVPLVATMTEVAAETQPQQQQDDAPPLYTEIEEIVQQHPLTVFSKTYCPYSRKAKEILNEYPLRSPYHVVEVDLRDDAVQVKQLLGEVTGRDTFPNIFVHGFSIGGANELEHMHRNGRLMEILRDNHLIS